MSKQQSPPCPETCCKSCWEQRQQAVPIYQGKHCYKCTKQGAGIFDMFGDIFNEKEKK